MTAQRVNEICAASGHIFGSKMAELMGTDKERDFMLAAMTRGSEVVAKIRDMVKEGITFDAWRDYFLDVSANIGGKEFFSESELASLMALHTELSNLDLHEYFDTIVVPYLNLEQLDKDVLELAEQHVIMREIWAEEDKEKGIVVPEEKQ